MGLWLAPPKDATLALAVDGSWNWNMRAVPFASFFLFAVAFCSASRGGDVVDVTICQLLVNPSAYDHKLIKVSGRVSFAFEEFTLTSTECPAQRGRIWLDYGGTLKARAIPEGWGPRREKALMVEGITTTLVEDSTFAEFDSSLHEQPGASLNATLVGRYFAGKPGANGKKDHRGFGMWGMFSLLVIQQVLPSGGN
jgi:hypothetical protein